MSPTCVKLVTGLLVLVQDELFKLLDFRWYSIENDMLHQLRVRDIKTIFFYQTKKENKLRFESYIRKGKCRPATTPTTPSRSGYPPWILKQGGLESSGQRLREDIRKKSRLLLDIVQKWP